MTSLLRRPTFCGPDRLIHQITTENANWEFVEFEVVNLATGQAIERENPDCETCAVVISGKARFYIGGDLFAASEHRASPFVDAPSAFYAPTGTRWSATAVAALELAICRAPAKTGRRPLFVAPEDLILEKRGTGSNTRYIYDILPQDQDCAESLLVLEARTPGGSWSSYPPHKHDLDNPPLESRLEETYYYRMHPPSGFAMQRVYTDDRSLDETMTVSDRDVVLVPKGYHPVCAPHGYDVYYLNVMAGPKRVWKIAKDPDHAWMTG